MPLMVGNSAGCLQRPAVQLSECLAGSEEKALWPTCAQRIKSMITASIALTYVQYMYKDSVRVLDKHAVASSAAN